MFIYLKHHVSFLSSYYLFMHGNFLIDYQYGIRLVRKSDVNEMNYIIFNARNEHDRTKFCEDLKEAILEMTEMEGLRIQSELDKLRSSSSSLVDITNNNTVVSSLIDYPANKRDRPLSRTLSNSLLDMALPMSKKTILFIYIFSLLSSS